MIRKIIEVKLTPEKVEKAKIVIESLAKMDLTPEEVLVVSEMEKRMEMKSQKQCDCIGCTLERAVEEALKGGKCHGGA